MKRLSLILSVLLITSLLAVLPAMAQDNANVITLNDASPTIDVVITLPADTTGTIALDFSGAAVRLTDANGSIVFAAANQRLHALELNIAPNSGSHTLTIERLPGFAEAMVRVLSLPELTQYGNPGVVDGLAIVPGQEASLSLTTDHPGDTVNVSVPGETAGMITATFPGAGATTQLVDAAGVIIVESAGGHVDGLSMLVDPGLYQFTLIGSGLSQNVTAGVRVVSADDAGVTAMQAPVSTAEVVSAEACTGLVSVSSVNLRSGPGTGYTVIGYGYRNQAFTVGGRNPENNWVLIALDGGTSAWVSRGTLQIEGACAALTTFNIPLRDAQPAPLVFATPAQSGSSGSSFSSSGSSSGSSEGEHEDEHEDEGEHEEGDDD